MIPRHILHVIVFLLAVLPAMSQIAWQSSNVGLDGADVTSLLVTERGHVVAGTRCGLYRYDAGAERWAAAIEFAATWIISNERGGLLFANDSRATFRSTDDGATWMAIAPRLSAVSVAGDGCVHAVGYGRHVYRSTDAGATWDSSLAPRPLTSVLAMSCADVLYAGGVLYQSWTGGRVLEEVSIDAASLGQLRSGLIYIGGDEPRVSTDRGLTWSTRSAPWPEDIVELSEGDLIGLLRGSQTQAAPGLYRSSDVGATWSPLLGGLYEAVELLGRDLWLVRGSQIERVNVDDNSRVECSTGLEGIGLRQMSVDDNGLVYGVGGSGERLSGASLWQYLYRSSDAGATWARVGDSIQTLVGARAGGLVFAARGMLPAATTTLPLSVSSDGGSTWRALTQPRTSYIVRASGDTIVALHAGSRTGTMPSALSSSLDRGRTWRTVDAGRTIGTIELSPGGRVVAIVAGTSIMAPSAIMTSDDFGRTWQVARDSVGAVDLAVGSDGTAYVLARGERPSSRRVLRSDDGGVNWAFVYTDHQNEPTAIDIDRRGRVWLHGGMRALRSSDRGASWEIVAMPVGLQPQAYRLRFAASGDLWFNDPPFRSTDDGATWKPVDGIDEVAFTPDGWLIGSSCRTYRARAEVAAAPSGASGDPADVLSVTPNPAIDRAMVTLRIPERGDYVLTLCDLSGHRVAVVAAGRCTSEPQTIELDTDHLAAGSYVLLLETPRRRTSRLVVVR